MSVNKLTLALLRLGEAETRSGTNWLKRAFGKIAPLPPQDIKSRLNSALAVVVTKVVFEACESAGVSTLGAQFDEIPANFHVVSMFGMSIVVGLVPRLGVEASEIDVRDASICIVDAVMLIRNEAEKREQYQLAYALLKKFLNAGPKATEWHNQLSDLVCMYLLSESDPTLRKHNYPSLFGSMLKTILSAFEP